MSKPKKTLSLEDILDAPKRDAPLAPEETAQLRRMGRDLLGSSPDRSVLSPRALEAVEHVRPLGEVITDAVRDGVREGLAQARAAAQPDRRNRRDLDRRRRYRAARSDLLGRTPPVDPTDEAVAEMLGIRDRTLRRWRDEGSI